VLAGFRQDDDRNPARDDHVHIYVHDRNDIGRGARPERM
jgi:hypothetical protein